VAVGIQFAHENIDVMKHGSDSSASGLTCQDIVSQPSLLLRCERRGISMVKNGIL
jgi:hypothetical protein